jgi:lysophospholipase L1-like esterase
MPSGVSQGGFARLTHDLTLATIPPVRLRDAFLPGGVICLFVCSTLAESSSGTPQGIIFDMETPCHRPSEVEDANHRKIPIGSVESIDGERGKAVRFSFKSGMKPAFMTASVSATADWDRAEGFSFFVKGDGSTNWAGLELIDRNDFALRYAFCFPLDSTEWRKVGVRWGDLTPELAGPLVDVRHGYAPSGFGNFWFGKWFYWPDAAAYTLAIDEVVLENKLPDNGKRAFTPRPPLAQVRAMLKAHQPISLVTMGDSLSDRRHWANRETLWSDLLVKEIGQRCGSAARLVNPAIGGTTLSQNIVLIPIWARDLPRPDLVTIWFGFNDWDSGVRGPRFKEYLGLAVDRIRNQTHGSADILLLTTCPSFSRWETMREMEQAAREVAQEKGTGLADLASEFRRAGSPEEAAKADYWARDKTHLGSKGHQIVAHAVLQALLGDE